MGSTDRHTVCKRKVVLALGSLPHVRVWPQETGGAVPLAEIKRALAARSPAELRQRIERLRPMQFSIEGAADVTGIAEGTLPDGRKVGYRLEVEVKTGHAVPSMRQRAFRRMVEDHGGVYLLVRFPDDGDDGVALAAMLSDLTSAIRQL